jgi:hypothetical protein
MRTALRSDRPKPSQRTCIIAIRQPDAFAKLKASAPKSECASPGRRCALRNLK